MKSQTNDPDWHLSDPRTRKWMIQCAGCHRWGYRHDAPSDFFGKPHLERYFGELNLDGQGLCEQCQKALE